MPLLSLRSGGQTNERVARLSLARPLARSRRLCGPIDFGPNAFGRLSRALKDFERGAASGTGASKAHSRNREHIQTLSPSPTDWRLKFKSRQNVCASVSVLLCCCCSFSISCLLLVDFAAPQRDSLELQTSGGRGDGRAPSGPTNSALSFSLPPPSCRF